jgi:glycosyltransferase involved in cell wall biosynthesis
MNKIVFYSESETIGGHEKMALTAHAAIQQRYEDIQIQWLVSGQSRALADALEDAGFKYTTLADKPKGSLKRNPFRQLARLFANAAILRGLSADLVVVVQGNIVLSYGGILASLLARLPYCSYIPMIFQVSDIRKHRIRIAARLLVPILYKTISSYITIDSSQAARLRRKNPGAAVFVVENYVPKCEPHDDHRRVKSALGIPTNRKLLALIGRIEFAHKCQDWVLRELKDDPFMEDKFVLFVGDGPDIHRLQSMLTPDLRDRFGILGWKDTLSDVYGTTDVLLIPSKNEGVPLVMLEALSYEIPVVGSDQDGMQSWLPAQWRFAWGDKAGFKQAVEQALSFPSPDEWANITRRLTQVHDEGRFATQFNHALTQCCKH